MALISKKVGPEPKKIQVKISGEVAEELALYMEFAQLEEDYDTFFEGAAEIVLNKDKEFVKWKKERLSKSE